MIDTSETIGSIAIKFYLKLIGVGVRLHKVLVLAIDISHRVMIGKMVSLRFPIVLIGSF